MDEEDFERMEIQDQADEVGYLTPREYAKLRYMAPQGIYYHIRNKHIEVTICMCGRKVINVKETDEYFRKLHDKRGIDVSGD